MPNYEMAQILLSLSLSLSFIPSTLKDLLKTFEDARVLVKVPGLFLCNCSHVQGSEVQSSPKIQTFLRAANEGKVTILTHLTRSEFINIQY